VRGHGQEAAPYYRSFRRHLISLLILPRSNFQRPSPCQFVTISAARSLPVFKTGNSLAVRLPAVVVEALGLKEGDDIEISIAGKRDFRVARDRSQERALGQLRQMKWSFPADFKFNRGEINER